MRLRAIAELVVVEVKLFLREPAAAFFTLVFPLMMLVLFGSIYGNKRTPLFGGYGYVDVAVPSFTAMTIATASLMSLPMEIAARKERGVLRRLRLTPLKPLDVLAAVAAMILLMTAAGVVLQIGVGRLLYDMQLPANVARVVLGFLFSAMSFLALGFTLGGLLPSARTALIVTMTIFYPNLFLSGATIPSEVLPESVRAFNQMLPLTHVVTLMRALWSGDPWSDVLGAVFFLAALFVGCLAVSARTFRWE